MARRSDPLRVLAAQLQGAHMRLADIHHRDDWSYVKRRQATDETHATIAALEAELAALESQQSH